MLRTAISLRGRPLPRDMDEYHFLVSVTDDKDQLVGKDVGGARTVLASLHDNGVKRQRSGELLAGSPVRGHFLTCPWSQLPQAQDLHRAVSSC